MGHRKRKLRKGNSGSDALTISQKALVVGTSTRRFEDVAIHLGWGPDKLYQLLRDLECPEGTSEDCTTICNDSFQRIRLWVKKVTQTPKQLPQVVVDSSTEHQSKALTTPANKPDAPAATFPMAKPSDTIWAESIAGTLSQKQVRQLSTKKRAAYLKATEAKRATDLANRLKSNKKLNRLRSKPMYLRPQRPGPVGPVGGAKIVKRQSFSTPDSVPQNTREFASSEEIDHAKRGVQGSKKGRH